MYNAWNEEKNPVEKVCLMPADSCTYFYTIQLF